MIIAFNGWGYSIARHLPRTTWTPPETRWTRAKAIDFARDLKEAAVLVGFSRGANAALAVAQASEHVTAVFAHSCSYRAFWKPRRGFSLTLFRTRFDRTPTWEGTGKTLEQYLKMGYDAKMYELDPVPWPLPPRGWVEEKMAVLDHQFHNCLPMLKMMGVIP